MASSPYLTGFFFSLSYPGLPGNTDAAFQEASGLMKEIKVEELGCGGENRFKYRVPTISTFQNLVLKRGVVSVKSPLIEWCANTLDCGLTNPIKTQNIQLNLLGQNGKSCMSWTFENAYPAKWSVSDFKSQDSEILIETIEFAYNYFDIENKPQSEE